MSHRGRERERALYKRPISTLPIIHTHTHNTVDAYNYHPIEATSAPSAKHNTSSSIFLDDQSPILCLSSNTFKSQISQEVMETVQYPTKSAASTDLIRSTLMDSKHQKQSLFQVGNVDNSVRSVVDTNVAPPESLTFTDLQPFAGLSIDDSSIVLEHLPEDILSVTFPGVDLDDWTNNLPIGPITPGVFDDIFPGNPLMTKNTQLAPVCLATSVRALPSTETRMSSTSSIAYESEQDDIQQQTVKTTGRLKRQLVRFGNKEVVKNTKEYHSQRRKNNEAVKKSREKAKKKQKESELKMTKLANENRQLNERVNQLQRELQVIKSLYEGFNQELPSDAVRALEGINLR